MTNTINLLLLGDSGVGKTTFVNSFLNYSLYSKGEDAQRNGVSVVAPMNITFTSSDGKHHLIPIEAGGNKEPQTTTAGKFKEYVIPVGDRQVRLIDSVGFESLASGDETFEDVFKELAPLRELHGVCFLIKSSLSRMNNLFENYMMQTLTAFDLPVVKNFIFVFTCGRSVSFRLEHAESVMVGFVNNIKSRIPKAKIPLNTNNMFCVENEGFINFAMHHKVKLHPETIRHCVQSWNISAEKCKRLLSYVETLPPYKFPSNDVINNLEQFILQKSFTLCDIFGENYKNLQKCKELKQSSEEACRLIQSIQHKIFSERQSARSATQKYEKTGSEKFKTSSTKLSYSSYFTEDESPSESEKPKAGHSQDTEKRNTKDSKSNEKDHQQTTQKKPSSGVYAQLSCQQQDGMAKPEKSKTSKSHHGSRDSLLTGDDQHTKPESIAHRKEEKKEKVKRNDDEGHHLNNKNPSDDFSNHKKTATSDSMENTNIDVKKKIYKKIADVMKDQTKLIQNMDEVTSEMQRTFLKDLAKFEIFLEINRVMKDDFEKMLKSLLYRQSDRDNWENMFREYEKCKQEVLKQAEYNLTDEDFENIKKKIEKLLDRQKIANKIIKESFTTLD